MRTQVFLISVFLLNVLGYLSGQDTIVHPTRVATPVYFDISAPLSQLARHDNARHEEEIEKERNKDLQFRSYPYKDKALPKGEDPVWQKRMGLKRYVHQRDIDKNFAGQSTGVNPPDCNGTVSPDYYMQMVNAKYTIYDKEGNLLAGPTDINTLFEGVDGSDNNDGDPIILYDSQADRWLAAEFSGVNTDPDYMLIAVSETNDPTGSWFRWSYEMNGFPDYMKFGIWRDGYYMGVNANGNDDDDIYVFERDKMIAGDDNPQMVAFDNPNRPNSGFHVVLPMDNDGDFAPEGTPGQFITINDDAWGGGGDELWIYELHVDWNNTNNSTFQRVQTIGVEAFDSDFGNNWENIKQKDTDQKLDAIPQVLMHRAQYRNFGDHQTVVCVHTVDVDDTDHAGLRWYELQNTGNGWLIRQQSTYAPDGDSRWMGSIAMNGNKDIAIGYSVSSENTYPSIRYAGQSATENANASGTLDVAETSIQEGNASQTSSERWGDYANMSVDPADDNTFWFTTEYNISGDQKGTRIASFFFEPPPLTADFIADNTTPCIDETVTFNDRSLGTPTSWHWTFNPSTVTFTGGTTANSQNPEVIFEEEGQYDVTLTVSDGNETDSKTKSAYISARNIVADFVASDTVITKGGTVSFTDQSGCNPTSWEWTFEGGEPSSYSGQNPPDVTYSNSGTFKVSLTVSNANGEDTETKNNYITVNSADILMHDGDETTCSAKFYDSGGSDDDYSDDEDYTLTISPEDITKKIQVVFSSFDVEDSDNCENDYFEIYDGAGTDAPLIGKYCGTDSPDTVKATNNEGKLTFHFVSDKPFFFSSTASGWKSSVSCYGTSLPLSLLDFEGAPQGKTNLLKWNIANNAFIDIFVVEKSIDGKEFYRMAALDNNPVERSSTCYSIADDSPYSTTYYRLKMIKYDGAFDYSKVISVQNTSPAFGISRIFPNPVDKELTVTLTTGDDGIRNPVFYIYNLRGRLMQMRKIHGAHATHNRYKLNTTMLPAGSYILKVDTGRDMPAVVKFVKE